MALRNGVGDFISKPFAGEEFIWRVQRVMQLLAMNDGRFAAVDGQKKDILRNDIEQILSPREFEIFNAIVKGNSDKQIAADLKISYWTVRTHVQQVFAKTGAINRRELMARYISQKQNS
jgi:DNA-binding NarL/FixJ family response regulator